MSFTDTIKSGKIYLESTIKSQIFCLITVVCGKARLVYAVGVMRYIEKSLVYAVGVMRYIEKSLVYAVGVMRYIEESLVYAVGVMRYIEESLVLSYDITSLDKLIPAFRFHS
jgi:hypothetical protein